MQSNSLINRQKNCINITSVCLTYDKDIFCKKIIDDNNENKSLYFNLFSLAYCISQTHDPKKLINLKEENDSSIISMMNAFKFHNNEVIILLFCYFFISNLFFSICSCIFILSFSYTIN